jgi:O-antigen ligase
MSLVNRVLDRVIFYGLLVTLVLTAIPYGTVQPLWIALFECWVLFLGLLGLADLLMTKSDLPVGASLAVPALVLCLFIVFQTLPWLGSNNALLSGVRLSISADRFSTFQLAIKLFAMIVAGLLMLRYTESESRLRLLVYTVIGVAAASALLGVFRQGGQGGPSWFFPLPNGSRGFAQFVNRNHFGFLMEMGMGLTLGVLARGSEGLQRYVIFLPAAIFLWVVLIISNTRGGIFASLCEVLFLIVLLDPLKRFTHTRDAESHRAAFAAAVAARAILIGFLVVTFAYGITWIGGEAVTSNLELTGNSFGEQGGHLHRENVSRKDIWSSTWQLIKAHPVAGSGFGGYWIAITRYHNASGTYTPQEAHNDYLELLASGGVIGCLLVLWFFLRFVKAARNTLRSPSPFVHAAALGAVTGIFGVMIHNFVDFGLHVSANALLFTALITIAGREGLNSLAPQRVTSLAEWDPLRRTGQTDLLAH